MSPSPEWMDYLRVPIALLFVVGLIVLAALFAKRIGLAGRIAGSRGPARLQLMETLYLDPKRRLVIVRCDGREHVLLLSATGDRVIESRERKDADAG